MKMTGNMFPYFLNDSIYLKPLYPCYASILWQVIHENQKYFSLWLPVTSSLMSISEIFLFLNDKFINRKPYELYLGVWHENKLIGNLAIYNAYTPYQETHISYWLIPSYQGRGIVTNSCRFLINQTFIHKEVNQLTIRCLQNNKRSKAIAERLGFLLVQFCEKSKEKTFYYILSRELWNRK